jgi:hypothetical protein
MFRDDRVGAQARSMCGRTCGCGSPLSPLFFTSGCDSNCRRSSQVELEGLKCTDVQPNSTGSSALALFATSPAMTTWSNGMLPHADAWAVLGCMAADASNFCGYGTPDGTNQYFTPFCPETCGCLSDAPNGLVRACPGTCQGPARELGNSSDVVLSGD